MSNEKYCLDVFESENQAAMGEILALGFVDVYRELKPLAREYTWYKNGKVESEIGSRLDYFLLPRILLKSVSEFLILNKYFGSDYFPTYLEIQS